MRRGWNRFSTKICPIPVARQGFAPAAGAILFSNCESQTGRVNLTLKKSADGGQTWERQPIEPLADYSCIRCAEIEID